ncbi:MAG TPA: caspase family protein [Longimicrobiales bacterium]
MCLPLGRTRALRAVLGACVLLAGPGLVGAQEYEAASLVESLDAQLLLPVSAGLDAAGRAEPDGRLPGFRLAARGRFGGDWTTHAGVMRLAPTGASLLGGVLGAGRAFRFGPLDLELGAEAVAGRAQGVYVAGEWRESDGTPHALLAETSGTSFGAGVTSALDWRFTERFSLRATVGYWALSGGGDSPETGGLYLGGGLSWLTGGLSVGVPAVSGRPTSGIVIRILDPVDVGERGITLAARGSRRIIGLVRDLNGAGIEAVRINGQLASLTAPDEEGVRFVGFVPGHEGVVPVEITASTVDGRIDYRVLRVQLTDDTDVSDDGPMPQRFAVVIGVSEYADPLVPDLQYADDDARAFYDFLRSERSGLGGIPEENVLLLVDDKASYRNMRSALFSFLRRATENDVVYVYIAAHGVPDPNRPSELYLLPADAEATDLPGTALPMHDVNEAIGRLATRHTVVITDACHSGGLGTLGFSARSGLEPNNVNELFLRGLRETAGGLAVFTAAEARQISREGRQWGGGHGVFTHYLLEGLNGEADVDQDSIVRLGELMEFVRERVRRDTGNAQIPAIGSFAHDRELPVALVPEP